MSLKAHEIIILSYINKFGKIDIWEIQKVINEPIVQLSNAIYSLHDRGYFSVDGAEGIVQVTEKAQNEPIYSWNIWTDMEETEFDGCILYDGPRNQYGYPKIEDEKKLIELLQLGRMKEDWYNTFTICSDEKQREIHAPSKNLKERQRWILKNILDRIKNNDCVHGFVHGKSIVTNASCHVRKKEILCMDISDFFPSININSVIDIFRCLGYEEMVAGRLGLLTTYEGRLPQGAPTSPALANAVFGIVDQCLLEYCKKNGLTYTRYADDLTFSTDKENIEYHILPITDIVQKNGFYINDKKTHVMKDNYRKIVTGLIVNEKVKVPKKFKATFRQEIYYCMKYGISQHLRAIGRDTAVNFKEYMYGKAYFIKMVESEVGELFLNQLDELFCDSNI